MLHVFSFRHAGEDGGDGDGCELEASSTGSHCGGHATRWLTSAAPVDILELLLLATPFSLLNQATKGGRGHLATDESSGTCILGPRPEGADSG